MGQNRLTTRFKTNWEIMQPTENCHQQPCFRHPEAFVLAEAAAGAFLVAFRPFVPFRHCAAGCSSRDCYTHPGRQSHFDFRSRLCCNRHDRNRPRLLRNDPVRHSANSTICRHRNVGPVKKSALQSSMSGGLSITTKLSLWYVLLCQRRND